MSLFKMPITIAIQLEKLQRQFLWGDGEEKRKIHLIRWVSIARKKSMGRLGIRRLLAFNSALLAKWWWRFGTDKQSLWLKVIKAKFGYSENAWLPSAPRANALSKVLGDISSIGLALIERCLKKTFPRLFGLSNNKEASVRELLCNSEVVEWNLSFRRNIFVWEDELLS
ncbi:hypothetical protein Acr_00g0005120 [Actinidia rufa]|uniref:Uncharacterized protein n=1 Tax=Actinidia rufa TaxID=165716 RepID=A0A7J0D915_9ERIC|nr:hypothetical protein Acr_00g0005120 [Actinidia rufa]